MGVRNPTALKVLIAVSLRVTVCCSHLTAMMLPNDSVLPRQEITNKDVTTNVTLDLMMNNVSSFMSKELLLNLNANLRCFVHGCDGRLFPVN